MYLNTIIININYLIISKVHNWTVEQTCDWLSTSVELPQYVPIFIKHRVTGAHLPRLVTNSIYILSKYRTN